MADRPRPAPHDAISVPALGSWSASLGRGQLLREIRRGAKRQDACFESAGGQGPHEIFWVGNLKIPVPRHREISERTAQDILHECEPALGKG